MPGYNRGFALIIGIANYPNVTPKLPASVLQDARDIWEILTSPSYCAYPMANVHLLLDGDASEANIRKELNWLVSNTQSEDTVIIFFSGHGGRIQTEQGLVNALLPYDFTYTPANQNIILGVDFTECLRQIPAKRLFVLFDCCYAGGIGELKGQDAIFKSGFSNDYYDQLYQGTGRAIMASSQSDEVSYVLKGMKNSVFTHYVLLGLRGAASQDTVVKVFDLFNYVSEQVPIHANQHPVFKANLVNNFPISLNSVQAPKSAVAIVATQPVDKRVLRRAIARHFSMQELNILCQDLQEEIAGQIDSDLAVSPEDVGGDTKEELVLNLINYLDRRGFLAVLISEVKKARPDILP